METKRCKQCGKIKPISQFRPYYNKKGGRYRICTDCERINSRAKYIRKNLEKRLEAGADTDSFRVVSLQDELDKINALWEAQRAIGLEPPRSTYTETQGVSILVQEQLKDYQELAINARSAQAQLEMYRKLTGVEAEPVGCMKPEEPEESVESYAFTPEIAEWLTKELTAEPDHYIEEVYEDLCKQFKPIKFIDPRTKLPVYDNTYQEALEAVLDRFYKYEQEYYKEDVDGNE